jgi:hypothetical protein
MADLDELLARMAKDAALLNAYHEWEMPAPAPAEAINYASVADRIERAAAAIASLREEREKADNALVDRYRDPKTGVFTFPTDVAAVVRRLDAAERERDEAREALLGWVDAASELADRPGMEAHFHDVADRTFDAIDRAREALSPTQKPGNGE